MAAYLVLELFVLQKPVRDAVKYLDQAERELLWVIARLPSDDLGTAPSDCKHQQ